jgi:hypothetical protein
MLTLGLPALASGEDPAYDTHQIEGYTVDAPRDWKVMLQADERNATMSRGITTSISV